MVYFSIDKFVFCILIGYFLVIVDCGVGFVDMLDYLYVGFYEGSMLYVFFIEFVCD